MASVHYPRTFQGFLNWKPETRYKYEWNKGKIEKSEHFKQTEFFIIQNIKRLQFNILEHVLVPDHRVLNNSEVEKIKLKYNIIDDSQFPDISRFDPVAQIIGIRPGQVCEIIRPSKTAINAYYYRICV